MATTPKGQELATIDQGLTSSEVLQYLADPDSVQIELFVQDPDEVRKSIDAKQLSATSLDDLLGESAVISGKNHVGKPFQLRSVAFRQSDFDSEGLPFYAVFDAVDYDGTVQTISCGARSVVQKAAIMESRGWLPAWVKITEGKLTEAGYRPLDLASAPEPAGTAEEPF